MRIGWRGALGIALSAVLLAWALRDVHWVDVQQHLRTTNVPLLALSAIVATLCFPLRAIRWRVILEPVVAGLPYGTLWRSTAIGMMVNNVVPARAGELARAYALARDSRRVSFSAAFASLAVDRVFDAFVIILLMLVAMADPAFPRDSGLSRSAANWAGSGVIAMLAFLGALYLVVFFPDRIIAMYEGFSRRVAPRFEQRGRDALLAFAAGLGVLRSPGRFATILWWTLLHWLVNALAFWIGFKAVGIDVPLSAALFVQGLIAIGVALPSSPGFFGIWEAVATQALALYGVANAQAITWAIGFHLLGFIPITVIGGWYFVRLGMHFRDLGKAETGAVSDEEMDEDVQPGSTPGGSAA